MKYACILLVLLSFSSCDAVNRMAYSIQNKSNEVISIHNPNYSLGIFSQYIDTIIQILPNETILMGRSHSDINFPWATKNIYREKPGICGLVLMCSDSTILPCDKTHWKYRRGMSKLFLK